MMGAPGHDFDGGTMGMKLRGIQQGVRTAHPRAPAGWKLGNNLAGQELLQTLL
jgi:hypothetical protein